MTIHRTKLWLPLGTATLAGGALLLAGLVASPPKSSAAGFPLGVVVVAPELHDVDRELRRVGLDPACLAAAGADATATTALANRAVAHLDATTYAALQQAIDAHASAEANLDRLRRAFRAGTQGDATQTDLDNAIAAEASARTTMQARQQDLYDAATNGLGNTPLARLGAIKAEDAMAYPDYFKVVARTHAQGIALRDAINGVRIDTKLGHTPSDHHQAIIGAQLADPTIATAKTAYEANLQAITNAWNAVLDPA